MEQPREGVITEPADLAPINAMLDGLVGQPCWKLGFSYGDVLVLDFGAQLEYPPGPLAGELYGEWGFYIESSLWALRRADGSTITSSADEREQAEVRFGEAVDRRVASVGIALPNLDLIVELDGGVRLEVGCRQEKDPDDEDDGELDEAGERPSWKDIELACWELYMPDLLILQVWAHQRWSLEPYRPGH